MKDGDPCPLCGEQGCRSVRRVTATLLTALPLLLSGPPAAAQIDCRSVPLRPAAALQLGETAETARVTLLVRGMMKSRSGAT